MAIRVRRGNQADFDGNKLVAGELGLVLDKGEVYFCYSPGNTRKLQTAEDLQSLLNASPEAYQALQRLIEDLTADPNELANILNNIADLQANKINKSDIIHTDTISDPTKLPSSAVTEALGKEIDVITNNLANLGKLVIYKKVGNQSIPTDTNTQVTFQAKTSNNGDSFSKIDTSTGRIKILETGIYDIQVQYTYAPNEAGLRIFIIDNFTTELNAVALNRYFFHRTFVQANAGVLLNIATVQGSGVSIDLLQNYTRAVIMQVAKL